MDITEGLVEKVRAVALRYDSAESMPEKISAGLELEDSVYGLSDGQVGQIVKMLRR